MKYKYSALKRRLSVFLASTMLLSSSFAGYIHAQGQTPQKHETVYVNLKHNGEQRETIVSNWLKDSKFLDEIADATNAKDINNVNNDSHPTEKNDALVFKPYDKDVIYHGNINKPLPISTSIKYYLDGSEISAKDIAGKSGKIKIEMSFTNNTTKSVNVDGQIKNISTPFTVATVIGFDSEKFSNLQADNAKIFSDGNNQVVMFVGFPGLRESFDFDNSSISQLRDIDLPQELTVTADVKNFELSPIAIAASPKLPDAIKDIDNDKEEIDKLQRDIDTAIESDNVLKRVDPDDTIKDLMRNPKKTDDAKLLLDDLFKYYDLDTNIVDILPKYVTVENIDLFDRAKANLRDVDINYVLDNEVIRTATDRLTDENIRKSKVLIKDYDELKTLDMDTFDKALEIINAYDDLKPTIDTSNKLYYKIKDHDDDMDKLDEASKYTDRIFDLLDKVEDISLGGDLTESDISVMIDALAKKKIDENSYKFKALFPENETDKLSKEQTKNLLYIINTGIGSGEIGTTTGAQLVALIKTGYVPEPYRTQMTKMLMGKVHSTVSGEIQESIDTAKDILYDVKILKDDMEGDIGYNYKADIRSALDFTKDIMPELRYLKDQKNKHEEIMDKAIDLASDEDDMRYYQYWANRAKEMKNDMDDNEDSIEVLRDLLDEYDDPKISYFYSKIPVLRDDFDELRPIANDFSHDLDIPKYYDSYKRGPEAIDVLVDAKKHLDENRYIADTMKLALDDDLVDAARKMIEIMDRVDRENKLDEAKEKIDDLKNSLDTKDIIVELSENYDSFSGKIANMDSEVNFVMKTDEIEAPEEDKKPPVKVEEKKGLFEWIKGLFQKK